MLKSVLMNSKDESALNLGKMARSKHDRNQLVLLLIHFNPLKYTKELTHQSITLRRKCAGCYMMTLEPIIPTHAVDLCTIVQYGHC